jgi:3-mercaptopyruvate sulfurtransferase SseA
MGSLFAYTPSPAVVLESKTLSNSINRSVEKQQSKRKTDLFTTLSKELPILQSRMIEQGNIDRAYVFEYVRRHLPGAKNIDTNDLIDDDSF